MKRFRVLVLVPLAFACAGDIGLEENAQCDGIQQPSEAVVDEAFDRDGDGYFDESNPGCAATYSPEDLDCDDGDGTVNPGAAEVCGDDIDNDCDGEGDGACSYSGTFVVMPPISYSCAYGLVSVSLTSVTVFDAAPSISFGATGAQPGTMMGVVDQAGTFSVQNTLSGACTETYTLAGTFEDIDTFTGTFTASFSGAYCIDCATQNWSVAGERF